MSSTGDTEFTHNKKKRNKKLDAKDAWIVLCLIMVISVIFSTVVVVARLQYEAEKQRNEHIFLGSFMLVLMVFLSGINSSGGGIRAQSPLGRQ